MHSYGLGQVFYFESCLVKPCQVALQGFVSSLFDIDNVGTSLFIGFEGGKMCQKLIVQLSES